MSKSLQDRARSGDGIGACLSGDPKIVQRLLSDLAAALDDKDDDKDAEIAQIVIALDAYRTLLATKDALLAEARILLDRLNRRGGLGLDVHAEIESTLTKIKAGKATASTPPLP